MGSMRMYLVGVKITLPKLRNFDHWVVDIPHRHPRIFHLNPTECGCLWCGCAWKIWLNYRLWSLANFHRQLEDVKTTLRSVQLAPFRFARCNTLRLLNAITSNKNHIYKYPLRPQWRTVCFATKSHTVYSTLHAPDKVMMRLKRRNWHAVTASWRTLLCARRNIILHRLIYSIAELSRLRTYWRLYFCLDSTCSQLWTANRFNLRHSHCFRIGFACEREKSLQ